MVAYWHMRQSVLRACHHLNIQNQQKQCFKQNTNHFYNQPRFRICLWQKRWWCLLKSYDNWAKLALKMPGELKFTHNAFAQKDIWCLNYKNESKITNVTKFIKISGFFKQSSILKNTWKTFVYINIEQSMNSLGWIELPIA